MDSLKLYLVTDSDILKDRNFYECIEEALKGGVTMLQLREKEASGKEFLEKVKLYLQTCCCIIKSDVEKFFRTDDVEDFEDFQKRGLN